MRKNLVVDMAQISAGKVKKSLLEQLERAGDRNAATEDIVDQYIVARNNMLEARKQGDARKAAMEISIMGRLLGVLRVAPESKRREEIDAEIKAQLEAKHLQGPIFDDWRERFLALWDAFQAANKSLVERGRSYITVSSSGKQYEKDNSASKEIIALERALHDALQAMDITVDGYTDPEDDEL